MVLKALGRVFKKIVFTGTLVGGIALFFSSFYKETVLVFILIIILQTFSYRNFDILN